MVYACSPKHEESLLIAISPSGLMFRACYTVNISWFNQPSLRQFSITFLAPNPSGCGAVMCKHLQTFRHHLFHNKFSTTSNSMFIFFRIKAPAPSPKTKPSLCPLVWKLFLDHHFLLIVHAWH
jgi:hypothetical protein